VIRLIVRFGFFAFLCACILFLFSEAGKKSGSGFPGTGLNFSKFVLAGKNGLAHRWRKYVGATACCRSIQSADSRAFRALLQFYYIMRAHRCEGSFTELVWNLWFIVCECSYYKQTNKQK
jgi:hypothetical protein